MAWEGSTRKARLPPNWPTIRAAALNRDGYRCTHTERGERCPERATDVHHLGDGNDHRLDNLASLCAPHHAHESAREGAAARARKYDRRRPKPPHPGLIG
jgi:5-methylcytosine-specific restriction protein A